MSTLSPGACSCTSGLPVHSLVENRCICLHQLNVPYENRCPCQSKLYFALHIFTVFKLLCVCVWLGFALWGRTFISRLNISIFTIFFYSPIFTSNQPILSIYAASKMSKWNLKYKHTEMVPLLTVCRYWLTFALNIWGRAFNIYVAFPLLAQIKSLTQRTSLQTDIFIYIYKRNKTSV